MLGHRGAGCEELDAGKLQVEGRRWKVEDTAKSELGMWKSEKDNH
jgi:hypothetical protein